MAFLSQEINSQHYEGCTSLPIAKMGSYGWEFVPEREVQACFSSVPHTLNVFTVESTFARSDTCVPRGRKEFFVEKRDGGVEQYSIGSDYFSNFLKQLPAEAQCLDEYKDLEQRTRIINFFFEDATKCEKIAGNYAPDVITVINNLFSRELIESARESKIP